jgi:translocation and assembly module TamA
MSVRSLAFEGLQTRAIAALALSVLGLSAACIRPASAFDFFGLFGGDAPPPVSSTALPYEVTFEVVGESDLESSLREVSTLQSLRRDAPPDGATLIQRANADFAPLIDAMWGAGYYNARVTITVAAVPLEIARGNDTAAIRAADAFKGRAPVPVRVRVEPGPLFKLRTVAVLNSVTRQPFTDAELPARIVRLQTGDPARSADLIAAQARIVDWFRSQARPLVKVPLPRPTVDHVALSMDIAYVVDTGPRAGIGDVTVSGPKTFGDEIVRSFIYLEPGEPYSPRALDVTRKSVATIPAIGSVRIREGDRLDAQGNLPIFVEVTERARNLVGGSAGFSTIDGPTGRVFYENRNLFGGAERLRLQGDAFSGAAQQRHPASRTLATSAPRTSEPASP